jgi:peptidoglycan/LPS O-acetylase OafA/YrhL
VPKPNNFDLIRLAAALQVAVTHSIAHLGIGGSGGRVLSFIGLFPGVPIFFFISGFLISRSFESNSALKEYGINRILRIYPGLIVCFFVSLASVALTGYFERIRLPVFDLIFWVVAQLSFLQFYNPLFMRHYGVGVLNGSMWTITVELQFYVLIPVVYALLRLRRPLRRHSNGPLLALVLIFLVINQIYQYEGAGYASALWYKLAGVSFLPWFYMFLVGVLYQRNLEIIRAWLGGRFLPAFVAYCVVALMGRDFFGWAVGNALSPQLFIGLATLIFAAAFSRIALSDALLRRNDVSYGVYIYHMPVANFVLAMGLSGGAVSVPVTIGATLALSYASWRWVEKPALGFKKHPLYQHSAPRA